MPPTDALYLRVPPELKAELVRAARIAGRTITEEATLRLRRSGSLGEAAVRVDPPAAAAPSASELAANMAGVSLAKDATPFPKGKQAGRAKS